MSWMSQLYDTYENNIGKKNLDGAALTPLAHMNANAQIEVVLDREGNFVRASVVDAKSETDDAVTLIPVTESSAGRSSGIAPHMLNDTLSYVAGDFSAYSGEEKQRKSAEEKYARYIEQLEEWKQSEYSHPKVTAVYQYISKKQLISDLVKSGIVGLDGSNVYDGKKIGGKEYEKALVRFRVMDEESNLTDCTWEDPTLIDAYTRYFMSHTKGKMDLCYLTGEMKTRTENHPKGIVAANYGAKLVSANDTQGFTFRGRFTDAEQAYSLSYEASQKIHSALTWLVDRQGVYVGVKDKRTFVCWNPKGKELPNIFESLDMDFDSEETEAQDSSFYRKRLWKIMQGYTEHFDETDQVIIMALDAATTGRLSITYYNEFLASDFMKRVVYWGETCNWSYLRFTDQKHPYYKVETPIFRRIVDCAFGREQGNFIETNEKILKEQVQRLVKCMLERQPMPKDIVHALTIRASTPLAYSRGNREQVLSTACAVITKYYHDIGRIKKGEGNEMKLDLENRDRSYLFGRLLAVLEKVERAAYERGETREPNAIQLQAAYVNHPLKTWMTLEDMLKPYFQKLRPGSREYYRRLISEITESFREEDKGALNQGLKENYLLGYYLQRAELNNTEKREDMKNEQLAEQD